VEWKRSGQKGKGVGQDVGGSINPGDIEQKGGCEKFWRRGKERDYRAIIVNGELRIRIEEKTGIRSRKEKIWIFGGLSNKEGKAVNKWGG